MVSHAPGLLSQSTPGFLVAKPTCYQLSTLQPSSVPETQWAWDRFPPSSMNKILNMVPMGSPQSLEPAMFPCEAGVEGGKPQQSGPWPTDFLWLQVC